MKIVLVKKEAIKRDDHSEDAIIATKTDCTVVPRTGEGVVIGEGAFTVSSVAHDFDTETTYIACQEALDFVDEYDNTRSRTNLL